jgi:hypothetical protein
MGYLLTNWGSTILSRRTLLIVIGQPLSQSVSHMVLFEQFLQYNNVLCYRNKEILVDMEKLSGMNATTEEYESAFSKVDKDTFHSRGMKVCSLEEQLDQVSQLYIFCCWGTALDSF